MPSIAAPTPETSSLKQLGMFMTLDRRLLCTPTWNRPGRGACSVLGTFLRQDPTEGPCPGRAAAARPPLQWATRLTDFPEVCPVGTFKWGAPILQTPAVPLRLTLLRRQPRQGALASTHWQRAGAPVLPAGGALPRPSASILSVAHVPRGWQALQWHVQLGSRGASRSKTV